MLVVWQNGHLDFGVRGSAFPGDRRSISYHAPGQHFAFKVAEAPDGPHHPLLNGPVLEAFEVDFYPLLSAAGLLNADFVVPYWSELTEEGKTEQKARVNADLANQGLADALDLPPVHREALIKGFHGDSLVAFDLGVPLVADSRTAAFIAHKNAATSDGWAPSPEAVALASLIDVAFPDFGSLPWDSVIKIRESSAGRDLRDLTHRLGLRLGEVLAPTDAHISPSEIVRGHFIQELIAEVADLVPTVGEVMVSFGANLLPVAGWAASAAEAMNLVRHRQSWVSLVKPPPQSR